MFVRAKEALINYIRMTGEREVTFVANSLRDMVLQGPHRPPRPRQIPDPAQGAAPGAMIDDAVELIIWEGELRHFARRRNNFAEGTRRAFATIWNMCTPALKGKIRELEHYEQMEAQRNPVVLIEAVSNTVCRREEHRQPIYLMASYRR